VGQEGPSLRDLFFHFVFQLHSLYLFIAGPGQIQPRGGSGKDNEAVEVLDL
jgi:hypothetical protein